MKFKQGDTVVYDFKSLEGTEYWNKLSENKKIEWYGALGYGRDKLLLFTYVCEHTPQTGHCMLVNMETQKVETMRHTDEFRLAEEGEC
jgi:hypothetical protein